ncbi:hypothetical protein BH10PSE19_BH10PSE19_18040 [soil metagenome]
MRKTLTLLTPAFLLLLSISCAALTLYEQPDEKSKVVVTLNKDIPLLPIFDPHKGDWIKVADPTNGNVGWIKGNELKSHSTWPRSTGFSVQEQTITTDTKTGVKPQTYKVMVVGDSNPLKPEEAQALVKQMQARQQQWQQRMDRMMERFFFQAREFEDDFFNFPLFQRVIIVPQQETKPTTVQPGATTAQPVSVPAQQVTSPQQNKTETPNKPTTPVVPKLPEVK